MKHFVFTALLASAAALLTPTTVSAQTYIGGWDTRFVDGYGREVLYLGDSSDSSWRRLVGTRSWCAARGAGYAQMRRIVEDEYDQILWWIDADCGSVVRVCVQNSYGARGCSSYLDGGWEWD